MCDDGGRTPHTTKACEGREHVSAVAILALGTRTNTKQASRQEAKQAKAQSAIDDVLH